MDSLNAGGWAVLAGASFLVGVSKTGFPGCGILAVPLFALVFPARASTGLILPLLIVGDVVAVAWYRRHAVWSHLVRLIPCAAAGIVLGWLGLGLVDDRQLRPFIGAVVLLILALNHLRGRLLGGDAPGPSGWWFPVAIGLLAGVTTMMANAAGPIMAVYLVTMRLPKNEFLGTGAWYFLLLNTFKVPFSAQLGLVNPGSLLANLLLAPAVIAGALLGTRLAARVPEKAFGVVVQVLAAAAAVSLIVT